MACSDTLEDVNGILYLPFVFIPELKCHGTAG
jgi:hypothetical protein